MTRNTKKHRTPQKKVSNRNSKKSPRTIISPFQTQITRSPEPSSSPVTRNASSLHGTTVATNTTTAAATSKARRQQQNDAINYSKYTSITHQLKKMQREHQNLAQVLKNTLPMTHLPREVQNSISSATSVLPSNSNPEGGLEFNDKNIDKLMADLNSNMLFYKNLMDTPDDYEMELSLGSDYFNGNLKQYVKEVALLKLKHDEWMNGQPTPYMQDAPTDYWDWKRANKRKSLDNRRRLGLSDPMDVKSEASSSPPPHEHNFSNDSDQKDDTQNSESDSNAAEHINDQLSAYEPILSSPKSDRKLRASISSDAPSYQMNQSLNQEVKLPVSAPDCLNEHYIERFIIGALYRDYKMSEQNRIFKTKETEVLDLELELLDEKIAQISQSNADRKRLRDDCENRLSQTEKEIAHAKKKSKIFASAWRHRYSTIRDEIFETKRQILELDRELQRQHVLQRDFYRKQDAKYKKELNRLRNLASGNEELQIYDEMIQYYISDMAFLRTKVREKEEDIVEQSAQKDALELERQYLIDLLHRFQDESDNQASFPSFAFSSNATIARSKPKLSSSLDLSANNRSRILDPLQSLPHISVTKNTSAEYPSSTKQEDSLELPNIPESHKNKSPQVKVPIAFV